MALDDLDLVCLAWREAPAMLARHHEAVAAALPAGWSGTVVLVENAAPPATSAAARALVARMYPASRRVVLRLGRNVGYAQAMNLGLAEGSGRFAALLNSDGRPEPAMLERLVAALQADPGALWAAPAVDGPGEPGHPPGPPYDEERLAGMALVLRRPEFLARGGFDPMYVFYNEDFEASERVREAGWRLLRVPEARFAHGKGGRSARGRALREFWFAMTHQTLLHHREPTHAGAAAQVARGRVRALRDHVLERDWPGAAGLAVATAGWPLAAARAERRRRRPWDAAQLETWLARRRPRAARTVLG